MTYREKVRIIADVHGLIDTARTSGYKPLGRTYLNIAKEAHYSIQLGDMGFDYTEVEKLDSSRHVFFGGNHDNYDAIGGCRNCLGDYGVRKLGPMTFFFIRGAYSIDRDSRVSDELATGYKSWWPEEELSYSKGMKAIEAYQKAKPDIMFSHDCPDSIKVYVSKPEVLKAFNIREDFVSSTQRILEACLEIHRPKLWCFGHFHVNWRGIIGGTQFVCMNELRYADWEEGKLGDTQ